MTTSARSSISLEAANRLIDSAVAESARKGFAVVVSVVDPAGALIALKRMDRALVGPVDVAIKKARTAALFGMDSIAFGDIAKPGGAIYSIEHTNGGLVSFGGGVALLEREQVIGGLGVAGASVEEDELIAKHAASALHARAT